MASSTTALHTCKSFLFKTTFLKKKLYFNSLFIVYTYKANVHTNANLWIQTLSVLRPRPRQLLLPSARDAIQLPRRELPGPQRPPYIPTPKDDPSTMGRALGGVCEPRARRLDHGGEHRHGGAALVSAGPATRSYPSADLPAVRTAASGVPV